MSRPFFGEQRAILQEYHAHGVRFRFPTDWELSEQESQHEVSITVCNRATSFWSLTLFFDSPYPEQLIESALEAFSEEYDELDVYPVDVELCRRRNDARDLEFICFELLNSAFLRAFRTEQFSALVLYQGTDRELEQTRDVLESISLSLECDGDEAIFT